jgi:hypothetical protein
MDTAAGAGKVRERGKESAKSFLHIAAKEMPRYGAAVAAVLGIIRSVG